MQYTRPLARQINKAADHADFKDLDGKPDIAMIAEKFSVDAALVKYILTGELPGEPKKRGRPRKVVELQAEVAQSEEGNA